jgi:hypothetical protein
MFLLGISHWGLWLSIMRLCSSFNTFFEKILRPFLSLRFRPNGRIFKCGCWQMITDKKHHCVSQDKLYFLSAPASHLQAWQYVRKIDHFSDRKPHRLLSQRAAIKSSLWASCVYSVISHCKYLVQKEHNVSTRPHNLHISQMTTMRTFDWKKILQREALWKVPQMAKFEASIVLFWSSTLPRTKKMTKLKI